MYLPNITIKTFLKDASWSNSCLTKMFYTAGQGRSQTVGKRAGHVTINNLFP